MEQSSYSKIIKALQIAYPYYFKDLDEESSRAFMQLYYSKLKKYRYEIVAKAIDNIISSHDFMPSLAEVLHECDSEMKKYYLVRINEMYKQGYFKTDEEYGKATMWLLENNPMIPKWLKKDVDKFVEKGKLIQIKTEGEKNE